MRKGAKDMSEQREPDKIIRAGGREFRLYLEYDDLVEHDVLLYPDFEEHPEHTDEGRPFRTAADKGCPRYKSEAPGQPHSGDCGCCGWFYREEPLAIIGVCMCEALRREQKEEEK